MLGIVIHALLRRQRKASLVYRANFRTARATLRDPISKKPKRKERKGKETRYQTMQPNMSDFHKQHCKKLLSETLQFSELSWRTYRNS